MKTLTIALFSLLSNSLHADQIYNGHDEYYKTLSGRVFTSQPLQLEKPNHGETKNKITVSKKHLNANQIKFNFQNVIPFINETASASDFEAGAYLFPAKNYSCIEGLYNTSGTGGRYTPVYLIKNPGKHQIVFKLPSLFNSCLGIRKKNHDEILFFSVAYRFGLEDVEIESMGYVSRLKQIEGSTLTEYKINNSDFIETGKKINTMFIEPENVYKFTIQGSE